MSKDNSPDVDRGWAFVVLFFIVVTEILVIGIFYNSSILYVLFLDEFQETPTTTSWAVNLSLFCTMAMAVLGNCFRVLVGSRLTIVIGCLMSTIGLISCSFVEHIHGILFFFGFVTGTGFSFAHFVTFSRIPAFFHKYRIIAAAVASSGAGIGQFLYAPLLRYLIDEYHWRGAFLILGALNMNLMAVAAALIPPRNSITNVDEGLHTINDKLKRILDIFKGLLANLKLFRDPLWIMLIIRGIFIQMSIGGFQTHIVNFSRQPAFSLSSTQLTLLPSLIGIGSVIARIVVGGISQLPKVHVVLMYILAYSFLVISCFLLTLMENYFGIVTCCFLVGLSLGGNGIVYETIIFIVGVNLYSSALSYALFSAGIGFLLGGPFAAWIYEIDPSYLWSFRIIGIVSLMGVSLAIPTWLTIKDGKIQQRLSKDDRRKEKLEARDKPDLKDKAMETLLKQEA